MSSPLESLKKGTTPRKPLPNVLMGVTDNSNGNTRSAAGPRESSAKSSVNSSNTFDNHADNNLLNDVVDRMVRSNLKDYDRVPMPVLQNSVPNRPNSRAAYRPDAVNQSGISFFDQLKRNNGLSSRVDSDNSSSTISSRASSSLLPLQLPPSKPLAPPKNFVSASAAASNGPSDSELLRSALQKITQYDAQVRAQAAEIIEKTKKIAVLENKLNILQRAHASCKDNPSRTVVLERENLLLEQRLYEMEKFLSDYGLVWIGESGTWEPQKAVASTETPPIGDLGGENSGSDGGNGNGNSLHESIGFSVDYDRIVKSVRELNLSVGESEAQVTREGNAARFTRQEAVPLHLYANGIMLFSGPFRPFTDPSTRLVVRDLQDGYFPSEMQEDYPNGAVFTLHDKRQCHYIDERQHRLAGEASGAALPDGDAKTTATDLNTVRRERTQHFLNRLPPVVVNRDGKIIDVREGIAEQLRPPQAVIHEVEVDTKHVTKNQEAGQATTLRIKSETGNQIYILKLYSSNTIADVRTCLDKFRPVSMAKRYDILQTFPRQVFSDNSKKLGEVGLVPKAMLYIQKAADST